MKYSNICFMKRLITFAVALGIVSVFLSSCVDDGDNHAEAKVSFQGVLTQLRYTLKDDTTTESEEDAENESKDDDSETEDFDYTDLISDALNQIGLTGPKSVIEESAKVTEGSISYAEYVCAMQAAEKIQKKLDSTTASDIKNIIFSNHTDEMKELGFEKAEDIPFETLSVQISYYASTSNNQPIDFQKVFL